MQLTALCKVLRYPALFNPKSWLIMKLTTILILAGCLQVSARTFAQTVTLSVKNTSLEKVFLEIKKQTGYNFVYNDRFGSTAKPVTVAVKQQPLASVLEECFRDQNFTYEIIDKTIIIKEKTPQKKDNTTNEVMPIPPVDVHGVVKDENGKPVVGASVRVKGLNKGTTTNDNGEFILTNLPDNAVLVFSAVTIETIETKLNGRTELLVKAVTKISQLEEVTISKGYYTTSQKLNTGDVVKINGSQITNQPISNPILGLEGLVPGLLITQSNGLPGSRFTALIRGKNSIQNGNSPLYMIDGVPFLSDNDALTQLNGMLANSPFNSIDPNDIESIEVLKDADATAIYGSRGAGGVVLITTKKNKGDKNSLSLSITRGWGKVARTMQLMNTQQYLEMRKEAFLNDGITPTTSNATDIVSWDQNRYTDWKKLFIGGTAQTYNAQVRYSGGNQLTKFSVGTGYYSESTVFPGNSGDKKTTVDFKINHKTEDNKLSLSFNTSYAVDKSQLPAQDLTTFILLPPNSYPLKDAAGNNVWREAGYSVGNPLATIEQKTDISTERLTANGVVVYNPIKSLEIKANFGYNKVGVNEKIISPMTSMDPAYLPKGSSVLGDNFIKTWIIEPQVSYKINLKPGFKLEVLAGTTWQKTVSERKLVTGSGYTNDALLESIAAAPIISTTNSNAYYNYAALFGRIGVDLHNKYIFNITGRRDGSSRFGVDNRFANFGAVGVAWIFSNESFIIKTLPFLSFGKLRGSFGSTGNDQIGNYQYLDTYQGTTLAYDGQPGLRPARLYNSSYSWEVNKKVELAAELGFINDKVTVNFNYYNNKSDNQIIRYSLPTQTGFANVLLNFPGVVQNKGFEFLINAEIISSKKFHWNASFNISRNQNILRAFPGLANSSYATSYVIDKPLNAYRGLSFTRIDPQTGVYQFQDLNKDGIINSSDYDYIGTTDPKYFGGFTNTFGYKGFQLSILLEFRKQLGRDAINSSGAPPGVFQNISADVLNRWRKAGDIAPYQRYTQNFSNPAYSAIFNMASSDAALTDASYIRLRNIALSYDFPSRWIKKINAISWKLFCQVQNLITITKYKGHDPENQARASLPPLRMITVGTQVNF